MAWWGAPADSVVGQGMNMSDIYPGVLWGTAPNAWFFRNSSAVDRMRSIVVFTQGGKWQSSEARLAKRLPSAQCGFGAFHSSVWNVGISL